MKMEKNLYVQIADILSVTYYKIYKRLNIKNYEATFCRYTIRFSRI